MIRRAMSSAYRFIDIGVNLTDPVFKGVYRGKQAHVDDFDAVIARAETQGVEKMLITVGQLSDANNALEMCKQRNNFYTTIGCHPTRCSEFESDTTTPEEYYNGLLRVATENLDKVVAIGECGLDYDRVEFCPEETQKKYFERQMELAVDTKLPMFLHCRAAVDDFASIYARHRDSVRGGVAHCFTGTSEEAKVLMDLGLYIGITGCSLKSAENLETMASIPSEFLMIETDAPWCDIRNTHAGTCFRGKF